MNRCRVSPKRLACVLFLSVFLSLFLGGCVKEAGTPLSPLTIRVTGDDFYWHFTYPGSDQQLGTADDVVQVSNLVVPLGRPVVLVVTSRDYVYTFRSTALDLLEVGIPELEFAIEWTPQEIGEFLLEVDPMCSVALFHDSDNMGRIRVVSPDRFTQWQNQQGAIFRNSSEGL